VECHRDILLGPYVGRECSPEVRGELRISVRDDLLWEAEPGVDVLQVERSDTWTGDGGSAWQEDGCSGAAMVDYGENGVLATYPWEACD
jgi:hypothetical protein